MVEKVERKDPSIRNVDQPQQLAASVVTTAKNQRQVKKDEETINRMAEILKRVR